MSTLPAYYNDNNPYVAQWVRNLIKAGEIPDGEVDERDIKEVKPEDVKGFRVCHWFCGIAGWALALKLAGWESDATVWTGSAPCQPFSAAGKRGGFSDDRHLWPAWFALIRECRPRTIFGEQVAGRAGLAWLDVVQDDLESEGYTVGALTLPACYVGAPHLRQRLWFVAKREVTGQTSGHVAPPGEARRMADATHGDNGTGSARRRRSGPADDGASGIVVDTESEDGGVSVQQRRPRQASTEPRGTSEVGELGDTEQRSLRGNGGAKSGAQAKSEGEGCEARRVGDGAGLPGSARDPWSNCEWIWCTDGKWRPAIARSQLLDAGLPPDVAVLCPKGTFPKRAAMLKGMGNSIVPEVAAAFITAYLAGVAPLR